jgi:PPK2 family polyphosphate:nucleotide phosphotransferase
MDCAKLFAVKPGSTFKIKSRDPGDTDGFKDKDGAQAELEANVKRAGELQTVLYAENKRSVLLVLQGMDTSGKDGTIKHVMSGLNPIGVQVAAFGRPTEHELEHDFLWRVHQVVPRRGNIGVFNRSHYEDVLVVRAMNLIDEATCRRRYAQINDFERMLTENGTTIIKCFLHISKDEQKKRLQERLADPTKNWKFQPGDLDVRKQWDAYMGPGGVYERAIEATSTPHASWHVVPADKKWFRNLAVSELLVQTLEAMKPVMPKPAKDIAKWTVE